MMTEEQISAFLSGNKSEKTAVQKLRFTPLTPGGEQRIKTSIKHIEDVPVIVTAELGGAALTVREVLNLSPGMLIKLDVLAGELVTMSINNQKFGRGEVMVINDNYGIRITSVFKPHSFEKEEEVTGEQ
jgi:flagellar motor switch protein FliN/FliY